MKYLESTLKFKPYNDIQEEVVKEWKKNSLFAVLQLYWYQAVKNFEYTSASTFVEHYNLQR